MSQDDERDSDTGTAAITDGKPPMVRRRSVLAATAAFGAAAALPFSAASFARVAGANDRVNVAVIGAAGRGRILAKSFANAAGARVSHICDVDRRVLEEVPAELDEAGKPRPATGGDLRDVLDSKDVDAVAIATPDHWHAPASLMALDAGKHVYVEKPCSHNPREGELLIEAQAKHGLVVQMGNQQRSSPESQELKDAVDAGELGDIYHVYTWYANDRGTIGRGQPVEPPPWLDWELWQGPAPRRAFQDNYVHYNWHWFWHWGTGELCNNAAHELDIARWMLDAAFPEKVAVAGARRFFTDDDWETYDTIEARYTIPGDRTAVWEGHSCNRVERFGRSRGSVLYGTKGHAIVDRAGYELYDLTGELIRENKAPSASSDTSDLTGGGRLTDLHVENFLDVVRGGSSVQSSPIDEGHRSTLLCLLGNIGYRVGEELSCDPANGRPAGGEAMALWSRTYEPGWEPKV
jgi:predicted dehydrogenase